MIDAAINALFIFADPVFIMYLFLGVVVGLAAGVLPGMGGLVGMTLLLPVTYTIDPTAGLAMLIGVAAVVTTSDTFVSVLMGVPGSAGSQATVVDGYPLAQRGEAARALSAAFAASMAGALIGAIMLSISLPIGRQIVLSFGSPELFMLSVFGLCMIGVLSGNTPLKGIGAGALGIMLGTWGAASITIQNRFTFGSDYLLDGFSIIIVSLGLYALPEFLDVLSRGGAIGKKKAELGAGWIQGVRDVVRHRGLVIRHSIIGAGVGIVPGLGASVVDWLNYSIVMRLSKDKSNFGQGDIRGVIAPESANNAKEGGAMIPTLLFGVPGSAGMALLLGAMTVHGLQPGPRMLSDNLELVFVLVWSLAFGGILGGLICFMLSNPIALITRIPFRYLFPWIFALVVIGAFQTTRHLGDLLALIGIGVLGWLMKRYGYPRAPLLIGFILSPLVERNLWITVNRFGMEWLTRPGVLILLILTISLLVASLYSIIGQQKTRKAG